MLRVLEKARPDQRRQLTIANVAVRNSQFLVNAGMTYDYYWYGSKFWQDAVVAVVHLVFAGTLFVLLAVFSLFLFTKSDETQRMTRAKRNRNRVYTTCGIVIVVALALIVVAEIAKPSRSWHTLFWLESVAVVSFGVSWLVKGEFLGVLADP